MTFISSNEVKNIDTACISEMKYTFFTTGEVIFDTLMTKNFNFIFYFLQFKN